MEKAENGKDIEKLEFDKNSDPNDYKVLVKKLQNISKRIDLLEKIFLAEDT